MTHPTIKPHHLQLTAYVYLPRVVPAKSATTGKDNDDNKPWSSMSPTLGWPSARIMLLDGDTGQSGSTQHGRPEFQTLLEAILAGKAGLVAARELSRLVRDNQDWAQVVRLCRFRDVLLADGHRLYNPADAQDRMVLGIQGAFNEFELSVILDRMQECLQQKAERGEQYDGLPPGYICRQATRCEKHPDPRVQRAIEKVLQDFERFPSVRQLYLHLEAEGFQLPIVPKGRDWRNVQWVTPAMPGLGHWLTTRRTRASMSAAAAKAFATLDEQGHKQTEVSLRAARRVGRVPGKPPRGLHPARDSGNEIWRKLPPTPTFTAS